MSEAKCGIKRTRMSLRSSALQLLISRSENLRIVESFRRFYFQSVKSNAAQ